MSNSYRNGTGFEFSNIRAIADEIVSRRESMNLHPLSDIVIVHDERHTTLTEAFLKTQNNDPSLSRLMYDVARKSAKTLLDIEPVLWSGDPRDSLHIFANRNGGEDGDVRDIYIHRVSNGKILRNIGLSIKWNHDAVKHPRISNAIDFGNQWIDSPTGDDYWNVATPIFNMMEASRNKPWADLHIDKSGKVYRPIMDAMMRELHRMLSEEGKPESFVRFIVGRNDFHKIVGKPNGTSILQTYSFDGTLSKPFGGENPKGNVIGHTPLPKKLVSLTRLRNNVLDIEFDGGWTFRMRIHNASSKVESSLKFDIRLPLGAPVQTFINH